MTQSTGAQQASWCLTGHFIGFTKVFRQSNSDTNDIPLKGVGERGKKRVILVYPCQLSQGGSMCADATAGDKMGHKEERGAAFTLTS